MSHKCVRVILFQVSNDREKLNRITHIAQECFEKREPLLIRLPHKKALEYVDTLLWRSPQDSFLPHVVTDESCRDLVVLTLSDTNPNQARTILNLCAHPIVNRDLFFTHIYEFDDLSSSKKNNKRYQSYKKEGYSIHLSS